MPYFTLHDYRLHYREAGSGRPLLILPGNTASSAHYQNDLEHFGGRYHAVALDLHGTGQSDRLDRWPAAWWQQAAQDAAALIEHLAQGPAHVIGSSGGAIVALWLASRYPQKVRSVIADSPAERYPPGYLQEVVAERRQKLPEQIAFWQAGHGDDWEQVVEADNQFLLRFERQYGGDIFRGALSGVRCPLLITASLQDSAQPEPGQQALRIAAQTPGSRVYLTNAGDHPFIWTQPAHFRQQADLFFQEIDGKKDR